MSSTNVIYTRDASLEQKAVKEIASLYFKNNNLRWSLREKTSRILVILTGACKEQYFGTEESEEQRSLSHFNNYLKDVISHLRSEEPLKIPISGNYRDWDSCLNNLKLIADYAPEEVEKDVIDRMNMFLALLKDETKTAKKTANKAKGKFLLYFFLVIFVAGGGTYLYDTIKYNKKSGSSDKKVTSSSSSWVGTWRYENSWIFVLRSDNTARVSVGDGDDNYTYNTSWEDAGRFAVIGAMRGETWLLREDGELFIRGTDGSTVPIITLKRSR